MSEYIPKYYFKAVLLVFFERGVKGVHTAKVKTVRYTFGATDSRSRLEHNGLTTYVCMSLKYVP